MQTTEPAGHCSTSSSASSAVRPPSPSNSSDAESAPSSGSSAADGALRAVIYLHSGRDDGWQIEGQRRRLTQLVQDRGWQLLREYSDTGMDRSGRDPMLAELEDVDVVVMRDQSRLTRNPREMGGLIDKLVASGTRLQLGDEDDFEPIEPGAPGRAFMDMMAAAVEYEQQRVRSERAKAAWARRRAAVETQQ